MNDAYFSPGRRAVKIMLLLVLCMFEICLQEEMTACVSLTLGTEGEGGFAVLYWDGSFDFHR